MRAPFLEKYLRRPPCDRPQFSSAVQKNSVSPILGRRERELFSISFSPARRIGRSPLSCLPPSPFAIDEASSGFDSFCIRAAATTVQWLNIFPGSSPSLSLSLLSRTTHTISIAPSILALVCEIVRRRRPLLLLLRLLKCVNFAGADVSKRCISEFRSAAGNSGREIAEIPLNIFSGPRCISGSDPEFWRYPPVIFHVMCAIQRALLPLQSRPTTNLILFTCYATFTPIRKTKRHEERPSCGASTFYHKRKETAIAFRSSKSVE